MSQFNFARRHRPPPVGPASQASTVTGSAVDLLDYEGGVAIVQSHGTGTGTPTARSRIQPTDRPVGPMFRRRLHAIDDNRRCQGAGAQPETGQARYIRYVGTIVTGLQNVAVVPRRREEIGLMLTTVERGFFIDFGTAATIGAATVIGIFDVPTAETFGMLGTDLTFTCAAADVPESPQARPSPSTPSPIQ